MKTTTMNDAPQSADPDGEESEEFIDYTPRPDKLTYDQRMLGAVWLRLVCSKNDIHYSGSEVLEKFTRELLHIVYPRYSSAENHRFAPSYYLICMIECVQKDPDLPFIPKFRKYTQNIKVQTTKKFGKQTIEYRHTYGLKSVVIVDRPVVEEPPVDESLTLEERIMKLEELVGKGAAS